MTDASYPSSAPSAGASSNSVPLIWNVPLGRNRHFVGREPVLARLRQALGSEQLALRVQALYGVGGVGKTQLAVEYAHRHRAEYDVVWWVQAETAASMGEGYAQLAQRLGASLAADAPLHAIREAVKELLDRRQRWLLILDNAFDPEQVRAYLPAGRTGHVLITTRQPNWQDVAQTLWLKELDRSESIALLRQRTGRREADAIAGQLAQALGDLPLALAQAAACIEQGNTSFSEYLRSFETHWAELLQGGKPGGDYPDSVAMTLELSMRQVERVYPASAELLSLCAFLAPDDIQRRLLSSRPDLLREPLAATVADPIAMGEAITPLMQHSLLETTEKSLSIHRLVGVLARDRMSQQERQNWAEVAVRLVDANFRFDSQDLSTWPRCAAMLPHALAASMHAHEQGVAPDVAVELLDEAGRYLLRRAQLLEAQDALERALDIARQFYGRQNARVSAVANDLGRVLTRLGRREQAVELFEQALDLDQGFYGHADPHVATVVNNYGKALHAAGDIESARKQFEWALQVYRTHYGPEHAKVAIVTNNLGYVLLGLGELDSAAAHLEQAMEIGRKAYGPDHPNIATIHYNLATLRRATGDRSAAHEHLKQALRIDQAACGPNHPDVARDLQALGELLKEAGEMEAAKAALTRAASIMEQFQAEQSDAPAPAPAPGVEPQMNADERR